MALDLMLPTIFTSYRPRVDKSASLTFSTLELDVNKMGLLFSLQGKMGALVFKAESDLTKNEILMCENMEIELGGKTKSERLRNVLYRNWELYKEDNASFDTYYATKMEMIITHYRGKLSL